MKWNVFSLETVKTALEPKFVLEKVRYVTDDEEYGEGESTRLVFRNVEEMPEIDYIKRTVCTFIQDTYVHFKDKSLKPMCIWQDNLNESEDHIRYSTNNLVSQNCISVTAQKCEAKNAGSCIRRRSSKSNKSSAKARPRPKYSGIAV